MAFVSRAQGEDASPRDANQGTLAYIQQLRTKHGDRIRYESTPARKLVLSFYIDCRTSDKRYLPMEHLLLARLAARDQKDAWSISRVESKGDEVRVIDETIRTDGRSLGASLAFELNNKGELRPKAMKAIEVLETCQGGLGQIWLFPEPMDSPSAAHR